MKRIIVAHANKYTKQGRFKILMQNMLGLLVLSSSIPLCFIRIVDDISRSINENGVSYKINDFTCIIEASFYAHMKYEHSFIHLSIFLNDIYVIQRLI